MQPQQPQSQSTNKKVLCIEDEMFISELYERALLKAGYEVTTESDGQRALELAQTNQYDIILLDLMLPSLVGADILATLRDKQKTPSLKAKIIVTTNLEQREEVRKTIENQADGYIIKANITPHELVEFLTNI